ncbi:MAG: hypothetical protein GYB67_03350 [Chloroflexi bacterium]|nr:hypothetical protein [Chloroflexota bacterium]
MSSTVTTSTVSTVTTMLSYGTLGLIVAVTLLSLLIKKEVLAASTHPLSVTLRRLLNVAIVPLLIAFVLLVGYSLFESI